MKFILVRKYNKLNFGSQLMYETIRGIAEENNIACKYLSSEYKTDSDTIFWKYRLGINLTWLYKLLNADITSLKSDLTECVAVVDIAGFSYGGYWGANSLNELDLFSKKCEKLGVPIIMAPQAFGTFAKPRLKRKIKDILSRVKYCYCRDRISQQFMPSAHNVKLLQDITFSLTVDSHEQHENSIIIIPNEKLLQNGINTTKYKETLSNILALLPDKYTPIAMVHGRKDGHIADELKRAGIVSSVIQPNSGLEAKKIISRSAVVVSSRYHGLVSSLSCGKPTIGLGWSHKYNELFNDFEIDEMLVSDAQSIVKLEKYLQANSLESISCKVRKRSEVVKSNVTKNFNEKLNQVILE